MSHVVRRAVATDAAEACRIVRRSICELCPEDHQGDPETLALWLADKTIANFESWIGSAARVALVAESQSGLAGFALLNLQGRLALLYVSPDDRFRGVSKSLLRAIESAALALGIREITLASSATARRFYSSCGYSPAGEPGHGFGITRSYPMRKVLAGGD